MAEPFYFSQGFDVDREDSLSDRKLMFLPRFPWTGEKDLSRFETGLQCRMELSSRRHLGPAPVLPEELEQREKWVSLYGVEDPGSPGKSRSQPFQVLEYGIEVVNVKRCPVSFGKFLCRHPSDEKIVSPCINQSQYSSL